MKIKKYAYHGTRLDNISRLKKVGIIPGAYSPYSDVYSEYDDGSHLFFSDDPEYIRYNYGDLILRFPWPNDSKYDKNKYGRYLANQFVSQIPVSSNNIEVEINKEWIPINQIEVE